MPHVLRLALQLALPLALPSCVPPWHDGAFEPVPREFLGWLPERSADDAPLGAPLSGTPLEGALLRAGGHAPDLSRWPQAARWSAARQRHGLAWAPPVLLSVRPAG